MGGGVLQKEASLPVALRYEVQYGFRFRGNWKQVCLGCVLAGSSVDTGVSASGR
jgi:hypothetical protein